MLIHPRMMKLYRRRDVNSRGDNPLGGGCSESVRRDSALTYLYKQHSSLVAGAPPH
jgi:hypothetical protein